MAAWTTRFCLFLIAINTLPLFKLGNRVLQIMIVENFVARYQARYDHGGKKMAIGFQLFKFVATQKFGKLIGKIIGFRMPKIQ